MGFIDQIKYYLHQQLNMKNSHNLRESVFPIFIVGSPRSGTSILALAIQSTMKIPYYNEGHFLPLINYVVSAIDNYYESKSDSIEVKSRAISHINRDELIDEVQNLFFHKYNSLYQSNIWLDKTPGIEMIDSVPVIAKTWPNAKFIFAKRRGIENINSRMRKFPDKPFEMHCKIWSACMKSWLEVKSSVVNSSIEIEQRDIENNPKIVSKRICDFLNIGEDSMELIYDIFTSKRPESTSVSRSVDIELNNTGWTTEQIKIYRDYCSDISKKFGYSETVDYYL